MTKAQTTAQPGLVSFVGAGPGVPDLLTVRGLKAIKEADLLLYAGSLVSPEVVALAKAGCQIHDSACLTLEECHALVKANAMRGGLTARVHTGDPGIYGALAEQTALLDADGIPWRVIPGVTAAMAAAAAAGVSFSLPETAQSLIITRLEGRTPMPPNEKLADLAKHGASMAIYLAGHKSAVLQEQLQSALPEDTPVVCASRVGWPEEKVAFTTIGELAACVKKHAMGRQTIFLILPSLACRRQGRSRLYHGSFTHSYRKGNGNG